MIPTGDELRSLKKLQTLRIHSNKLTRLDNLPSSIVNLDVGENQLTSLAVRTHVAARGTYVCIMP